MTKGEIDKFEAAQRQLDCAIRLWFVDEESLAIHTLAYAACCILRDLLGSQKREVLSKFEVSQKFGEVPNFLKHADRDPEYVLIASLKGVSSSHSGLRDQVVGATWPRKNLLHACLLGIK
jgi:hypothetical protein